MKVVKVVVALMVVGIVLHATNVFASINDFTLKSQVDQRGSNYSRTTTVSLRRTQNNEIFRNQSDIRYMMERAMDRARTFMAQARSQMSNRMSNRDDISAKVREVKERAETMRARQKMMMEWQQQRLKDMQQFRKSMVRH